MELPPESFKQQVLKAMEAPAKVRASRMAAAPGPRPVRTEGGRPLRLASVLLVCVPHQGDWTGVLMERTPYRGVHSGEVSIPGGEVESGDASRLDTALREFEEEMGVAVPASAVVGRLTPLFIPPSGFEVEAFVAVLDKCPKWTPDPLEVAAVLHLPLSPRPPITPQPVKKDNVTLRVPGYGCEGRVVWGATAILLTELFAALEWAERTA